MKNIYNLKVDRASGWAEKTRKQVKIDKYHKLETFRSRNNCNELLT